MAKRRRGRDFNVAEYMHPQQLRLLPDLAMMDDVLEGERAVKDAGPVYLPMTEGQRAAGRLGKERYAAYKLRANFPVYTSDTQTAMLGVMHENEPDALSLPDGLEGMRERATVDGLGLADLLKSENKEQLGYGRLGLLLDPPTGKGADLTPVIALYPASKILSWNTVKTSDGLEILDYLLLDESSCVFNKADKSFSDDYRFRICAIDPAGDYYSLQLTPEELDEFNLAEPLLSDADYPMMKGKRLQEIPFAFVNADNLSSEPSVPPLKALADICLAAYRGEADYRNALYSSAQAILFVSGMDLAKEAQDGLGGGSVVSTSKAGATMSYVEPAGNGLDAMQVSQSDYHKRAQSMGVALIDQGSSQQSGAALSTRLTVKTGSMKLMAVTAARGLEKILKLAARWCGFSEDEVSISPYLDFQGSYATAQDVLSLWQAVQQGALSPQTYHEWLVANRYTSKTYDDEQAEIEEAKADSSVPSMPPNSPDAPANFKSSQV